MSDSTADREIVVSRVINAPRELIFDAFTQQEHAKNWWVPRGTQIHEYNAKPGGFWRYSQTGPDGSAYPFRIEFIELEKPSRLVYDFATDVEQAPEPVRTTVTFDEEDGKTKVTLQLLFATTAAREEAAKYGGKKGAQMALANVAKYLETL